MDDMLDSLTKQGRKLKQRLRGKKDKPDKKGASTTESVGSSNSLLRPAPRIAAGGHSGTGSRTSIDERQIHSRDRSPQPESISVEEKPAEVGEAEVSKECPSLDPDAGVVEDSREAERVPPSLSSPPTPPPARELGGT